jgi:hypothetical protein
MSPISQSLQGTIVLQFIFKSLYTTNRFDECRGFSCRTCEFSALPVVLFWLLMYPLKYNRALPKPLPLKKKLKRCCWLQNYRPTGSQPDLRKTMKLCWTTQQMLEMSTATLGWDLEEGGRGGGFLWAFFSWSVCCLFCSIPCMKCLLCVVSWGGYSTIWYDAGKYKN